MNAQDLAKKYLKSKTKKLMWVKIIVPLACNPITWGVLACIFAVVVIISFIAVIPAGSAVGEDGTISSELIANVELMQEDIQIDYNTEYFPTAYVFAADNVARQNWYEDNELVLDETDDYGNLLTQTDAPASEDGTLTYTYVPLEEVCAVMKYTTADCDMFNAAYELWDAFYIEVINNNGGLLYPVKDPYTITQVFGSDEIHENGHYGVDFVSHNDQNIYASATGTVIYAYNGCDNNGYFGNTCGGSGYSGYGNAVVIEHQIDEQIFYTLYAHMSEVVVQTGDQVVTGQPIGVIGNSGSSTGTHLHFELRIDVNDKAHAVDPIPYLDEDVLPEPTGENKDLMLEAGIAEEDLKYANYIITKESNWDFRATNPDSGAYGLCQALPPEKMNTAGSDWKTNPVTQLEWCNSYAIDTYNTWEEAYDFWLENHWW